MMKRKKKNKRSGYSLIVTAVLVFGLTLLTLAKNWNGNTEEVYDAATHNTTAALSDSGTQDESIMMPAALKDRPETILRRKSYVVSYNKETLQPNWVAWHLTAAHADGPTERSSAFREDKEVPEPRATLEDYKKSGWSRGHMCPAGDNKWDELAMKETFLLTNICPQNSKLNSGLWNSLEMDCRQWAKGYGDIYIVCGPVFTKKEHETIGKNKVVVPEAFFKVVLCMNGKPKAFGIIVRNTEGNKKKDLYYNSVNQVERITGIDFFTALPDEIQSSLKAFEVSFSPLVFSGWKLILMPLIIAAGPLEIASVMLALPSF